MCKPQECHTDLIPKQMIGQTLVEVIYLIHFSWLYLYVLFLYTTIITFKQHSRTQSLQQKPRVLQACQNEKSYERQARQELKPLHVFMKCFTLSPAWLVQIFVPSQN